MLTGALSLDTFFISEDQFLIVIYLGTGYYDLAVNKVGVLEFKFITIPVKRRLHAGHEPFDEGNAGVQLYFFGCPHLHCFKALR